MAKVFLDQGETFRLVSPAYVYGAKGIETIEIDNSHDIVLDANIENIKIIDASINDIFLDVRGNILEAKDSAGELIFKTSVSSVVTLGVGNETFQVEIRGLNEVYLNGSLIPVENAQAISEISAPQNTAGSVNGLASAQTYSNKILSLGEIPELEEVNSILSGEKWHNTDITFGFPQTMPSEYEGLVNGWGPISEPDQIRIDEILSNVNNLLSLELTKEEGDSSLADIRISAYASLPDDQDGAVTAGFAYYPGPFNLDGDVFISKDYLASELQDGREGKLVFQHELGHALGLKHPFEEPNILDKQFDYDIYTIMSYDHYRNVEPVFTVENNYINYSESLIFPDSYGVFDYVAFDQMYGLSKTYRDKDNIYKWSYNINVDVEQSEGNDKNTIVINSPYTSIYDAGGEDTLDLSLTESDNVVKLSSGGFSDINKMSIEDKKEWWKEQTDHANDDFIDQMFAEYSENMYTGQNALSIAYGTVIENVIGGSGKDTVWDNMVDNKMTGNAGDDVFYLGRGGFDTIDGGEGIDKIYVPDTSDYVLTQTDDNAWVYIDQANNFSFYATNVEDILVSGEEVSLIA